MDYMQQALQEAYTGIEQGDGGPFGTVIVKDDTIVGRGHNRVLAKQDPTCHGEMEAIRDACKNLGTFDLSGCTLYTTAEPCPMCLGGILWANISGVVYGCSRTDTDAIGFRDDKLYDFFAGKNKLMALKQEGRPDCLALFKKYAESHAKRY